MSSAVRHGRSSRAAASARSARAGRPPTTAPPTETLPASGSSRPATSESSVDFPDAAPTDDPDPSLHRHPQVDAVEHALPAEHPHDAVERDTAPRPPAAPRSLRPSTATCAPFAGMTRIRFDGYTLGSALSAPRTGTPRFIHKSSVVARSKCLTRLDRVPAPPRQGVANLKPLRECSGSGHSVCGTPRRGPRPAALRPSC